jgi:pimeloyl-ACP methyl ester carboxylesterase
MPAMRWLTHDDGTVLWHDDQGSGDPALVFVHGFGCDHTNFEFQVRHFSPTRRVVSVDLRGHGRSEGPVQEYTIDGFADDVAWLCDALGLVKPIVAGHSMGGMVAATVAERHPHLLSGVVILDAAVVPRPELIPPLVGWADSLRSPTTFRTDLRSASDGFFSPFDDPDMKRRIQDGVYAPHHVMLSSAEAMTAFLQRALSTDVPAGWTMPAANIAGPLQMNDMDRFTKLCPQLISAQVLGAGHWYMLEVPDQLNAMLERFISIVESSADSAASA